MRLCYAACITPECQRIEQLIEELRRADSRFRVAGASRHKYFSGPRMTPTEVAAFEAQHSCRLPRDYRDYLLEIGNGGVGPGAGLKKLSAGGRDLGRPCPLTRSFDWDPLAPEDARMVGDWNEDAGIIDLGDQDGGFTGFLVVTGPLHGAVFTALNFWVLESPSFSDWYCAWASLKLQRLANEWRFDRVMVGMRREAVMTLVPASWQEADTPYGRFMSSQQVPGGLHLDPDGVVTGIDRHETI
jgi:hypothetical protein